MAVSLRCVGHPRVTPSGGGAMGWGPGGDRAGVALAPAGFEAGGFMSDAAGFVAALSPEIVVCAAALSPESVAESGGGGGARPGCVDHQQVWLDCRSHWQARGPTRHDRSQRISVERFPLVGFRYQWLCPSQQISCVCLCPGVGVDPRLPWRAASLSAFSILDSVATPGDLGAPIGHASLLLDMPESGHGIRSCDSVCPDCRKLRDCFDRLTCADIVSVAGPAYTPQEFAGNARELLCDLPKAMSALRTWRHIKHRPSHAVCAKPAKALWTECWCAVCYQPHSNRPRS